jgi:hypothetical protein
MTPTRGRLALLAVIILAWFGVFEASLRVAGSSEADPTFRNLFTLDPVIGYRLHPVHVHPLHDVGVLDRHLDQQRRRPRRRDRPEASRRAPDCGARRLAGAGRCRCRCSRPSASSSSGG